MAYNTEELEAKALEVISGIEPRIVFIEQLVSYLPCDKKTFYAHNLHESPAIKDSIEQNKIDKKAKLRDKWEESDSATLQIALYKLIGNEGEKHALNGTKIDHSHKDVTPKDYDTSKMTMEDLKEWRRLSKMAIVDGGAKS